MSTVAPLVDENGQDQWTAFEAAREQMRRERRSGSATVQVHFKHGQEAKVMVTLEQVAHMGETEALPRRR